MFGKMHRYRIYFWFFWIKSWRYSTNCETQSTFDSNASIKYKSSLLTDSKQEWAPGKSRRRGMEYWVQESNKGLRERGQVRLSRRLPLRVTYINSLIVSVNARSDWINKESRVKFELTYISNSLSTSSGVTSPWTSISGGLCCSIRLALIPRSVAGPVTQVRPIRPKGVAKFN